MIIFDFDGTIADTMPFLEKLAVKLITKYYQLNEEEARNKYRNTTGLPFKQQIGMLFPENSHNKDVIELFEKEKIENIFDLPLFSDALDCIHYFKKKGYLVTISSSTKQAIIKKYCQMKELEVDQILGFKKGFEKGKDHFNFLRKKFNLEPNELVFIGDSLIDCKRAQNSNVLFIARIGLFSREQFNKISKSTICIHRLNELKKLIPRLQAIRIK